MDKISKIRKDIDAIDYKILALLGDRHSKVIEIGKLKKKGRIKIKDKERELEILSKLEEGYEKEVFKKILIQSRKIQS